MLVPVEKIELAKKIYDGRAIEEIVDYFGLDYNEKTKAASCPFHEDKTPSFIWNDKSNCFHCFGEETEVITKKGVFPISEIKNKPVEIINGNGEWERVIFKSYGVQKLLKVTLVSHEKQKTIFATPEHEWIVRDKKYKIKTIDLKVNDVLARVIVNKNIYSNKTPEWKVVSVEETDREEEVYCCVTSTHSFVLKDFILTGNCFGCSKNFGIIDLYMEQGLTYLEAVQKLFEKTEIEYSFGEKGIASKPSYVYPKREENNDMTKVIEYWGKRGISEKTLKYADIQADKFGNTVFNYYNDSDVLMNVKYRPSHKIQKGETKCWFQKGTSFSPVLFNMNKCDPSKPLYIQEGEGDCLSVIEAGYTNVVSVPNGSQNMQWIEENWDWLSQFPKIIIWSDNDEPGKKMRKEAIHRLGSWRTYYIEITDHVPDEYAEKYPQLKGKLIKDANELLFYYGKEKVLSYLNNPLELPVENVSDLSKAEDFDINNAEGLYTGIKDLDNQIYKIVFGTVNIVTGKSGCVDCDTEYFNGTEWKKISNYIPGDKVLQYTKEGKCELVNPIQYHKYEETNLWHLKTKYGLDMCVSDEHNMCYITSKGNLCLTPFKEFKEVHDRSVNGHQGRFITSFKYSGKGISLTDDEIKLMLAVICDGNFNKKNKTSWCRINIKKQRKKEELEKILNSIGLYYKKIDREDDYTYYLFNAPIKTKKFPKEWYNCSAHQFRVIVDNIYKWDGDNEGTSWRFFTTDEENADFIQFAASACGYRATINKADRRGRVRILSGKEYIIKSVDYIVHATTRNLVGMAVVGKYNKKNEFSKYKTLDGYKYCFTVPSHMWVMRRNGRICVTGNSGKSVFVNQIAICQALQQGYDVFVFSGELPTPHLKNWVETNMIGRENITMENGHIRHLNLEARKKMRQWYSGRVMVYDDGYDTTAKALLIKMEEMARKFGTKVFLIDNLMMVDLECSEEGRLQAEKNFIKELIFFAKKFNVLVFLVAHPRKIGGDIRISKEDIAGSSNIVNLAHTVFSIHRYTKQEKEGEEKPNGEYFRGKEPKEYDTVVEVLKNRITGLLPECEMYFDYNSYRFYRTPEELWMRYKWNTDTSPLPTTDPNNHRKEIESPL